MSVTDKLRNRFRMGKGRANARRGRAAGNPRLEMKGQAQRLGGAARQIGEQAKNATKNARDAFKE